MEALLTLTGYVSELRQPYVQVVLDETEVIENGERRLLMPYDRFQKEGLTYQGARFLCHICLAEGRLIAMVEPDPAWEQEVDIESIRAKLERDLEETKRELYEEVSHD